jgi:long-chain acyl-CoA synthetase
MGVAEFHPFHMLARRASATPNNSAFGYLKLGAAEFESFQIFSWKDVYERALKYGQYLRSLNELQSGDRIALIGKNGPEWVLTDIASMAAGFVTVPLSIHATDDELNYCLKDAAIKVVFCDQKNSAFDSTIRQITFSELENAIQILEGNFVPSPVPYKEMNTIVYTSGTSGHPKGVMHSLHSFELAYKCIKNIFDVRSSDVFLSYLPLSHIAERVVTEFCCMYSGGTIFFLGNVEKLSQYLPKVRPTIFLAVPRIWDMIRFRVERELSNNSQLQDRLQRIPFFLKGFILSKFLKKKLGFDRARILISGAAKLNPQTAEAFHPWGISIVEGYGLTETLCMAAFNPPKKNRPGTVGQVCPGVIVKLSQDGEILIKSDFLFLGYLNRPEETAEVLKNGWFHTGDIGRFDSKGYLTITDRKKNIFKTLNGKYVAPLPIEVSFKNHPGIREIMVIGDNRPHCVALASVDDRQVDEKSMARLLDQINSRLPAHEQIKSIACTPSTWEITAGEMTASLKLKRKVILDKYQQQIEDLYNSRSRVKFFGTEKENMEKENSAHTRFQ